MFIRSIIQITFSNFHKNYLIKDSKCLTKIVGINNSGFHFAEEIRLKNYLFIYLLVLLWSLSKENVATLYYTYSNRYAFQLSVTCTHTSAELYLSCGVKELLPPKCSASYTNTVPVIHATAWTNNCMAAFKQCYCASCERMFQLSDLKR